MWAQRAFRFVWALMVAASAFLLIADHGPTRRVDSGLFLFIEPVIPTPVVLLLAAAAGLGIWWLSGLWRARGPRAMVLVAPAAVATLAATVYLGWIVDRVPAAIAALAVNFVLAAAPWRRSAGTA